MADVNTTATTTAVQPKNIYASGKDYAFAQAALNNLGDKSKGYNLIDIGDGSFNPSSMAKGSVLLGGTGVNTGINNDMLVNQGVNRLWGNDAQGTAKALQNYINNGGVNADSNAKYVYGNSKDLQGVSNLYTPGKGYKLVDINSEGFDPTSMQKGSILLGGAAATPNITDSMLNTLGVNRIYGADANETANKAKQYYTDTLLTPPSQATNPSLAPPTINPFKTTADMKTMIEQQKELQKPQLELANSAIETNYNKLGNDMNNSMLKRGMARSTIQNNEEDRLGKDKNSALSSALLNWQNMVNQGAANAYDKQYDRDWNQYAYGNDQAWKIYGANNDQLWNTYNANMDKYKVDTANEWQQKSYDNDNYWKNKTYDNDNYWKQKTFDNDNYWKNVSLSRGGGGSGGGSSSAATKASQANVDKVAMANFDALTSPQDQYALLQNPDFVNSVSSSTYKSLQSKYQTNLKNSELTQSLVSASQPTWNYTDSPSYIYSGSR